MGFSFYELLKESFTFGTICAIIAVMISPLQFIKIIRQQTGESYAKIVKENYKKHGIAVFYRGAYPYGKLQFLSSFSFGFSEFCCIFFLTKFNLELSFAAIFIRAISAGLFETTLSVKAEMQEISRNKGDLMKQKGTVASILEAIFMRNTLFWMASLVSFYFINKMSLSGLAGGLLAFVLGIIFAVITIPIDLVATHNCGDDEKHSVFSRIKKILTTKGCYSSIYYGSFVRVFQISIFTVVTTITEMIVR